MAAKNQNIILSDLNLQQAEVRLCTEALKRTDSLVEAAELLGINRHALRRLIAKHNLIWWPWAQKHKNWNDEFEISPIGDVKIEQRVEFSANSSRTILTNVDKLYNAFYGRNRNKWLKTKFKIRCAKTNISIMIDWYDGTNVEIYFREKGKYKSQINVMHKNLTDSDDVSGKKDFWIAALDRLQECLS